MPLSLYEVTIPVFIRSLGNLAAILEKARVYADESGSPHSSLTEARLFPDMLPLTGQIQRASDTARYVPVRVGGVDNVSMPDNETGFDELQDRITATIDFLKAVPAGAMDGREDTEVVVKTRFNELKYGAVDYILSFAIPNFFFHVTTAYDILRHKGVPVGKMDYLARR